MTRERLGSPENTSESPKRVRRRNLGERKRGYLREPGARSQELRAGSWEPAGGDCSLTLSREKRDWKGWAPGCAPEFPANQDPMSRKRRPIWCGPQGGSSPG